MTGAVAGKYHRRSIRLAGYDYSWAGAYFVTICAHDRICQFGDIMNGEMRLNDAGRIVERCWREIPAHFPHVELDEFVIMPNHIHGILVITNTLGTNDNIVGATHASPLQQTNRPCGPKSRSIAAIVGSFKSAVTKRINEMRGAPGEAVWQRNYYEHIIRDDESLNRIREYIMTNTIRWEEDEENPNGKRQKEK